MAATHRAYSPAPVATHARAMDENIIVTTFSEDSRPRTLSAISLRLVMFVRRLEVEATMPVAHRKGVRRHPRLPRRNGVQRLLTPILHER